MLAVFIFLFQDFEVPLHPLLFTLFLFLNHFPLSSGSSVLYGSLCCLSPLLLELAVTDH